jgi:hypothetical protein
MGKYDSRAVLRSDTMQARLEIVSTFTSTDFVHQENQSSTYAGPVQELHQTTESNKLENVPNIITIPAFSSTFIFNYL